MSEWYVHLKDMWHEHPDPEFKKSSPEDWKRVRQVIPNELQDQVKIAENIVALSKQVLESTARIKALEEALNKIQNCMLGDAYEKFGSEGIIVRNITIANLALSEAGE